MKKIGNVKYELHYIPCNYHTNRQSSLDKHLNTISHKEKCEIEIISDPDLYCETCEVQLSSEQIFKEHQKSDKHYINLKLDIPEKKYKCDGKDCNYSTNSKTQLKEHKKGKLHSLTKEEKKKFHKKQGSKNLETGYTNEKFINNIISSFDNIDNFETIGGTGNKYDVKYKLIDEDVIRFLQVKTISKDEVRNSYRMITMNKYENDTLIVGVNPKDNIFCLIFMKDVKNISGISFYPNTSKVDGTIYNKYFYINKENF